MRRSQMARNVVQFQVFEERDDAGKRIVQLFTLCDDGSMFRGQVHGNGHVDWQDLCDVPQEPY